MDLMALMLSVEVTRREARSALPRAEVRRPADRWRPARAKRRRRD